MSKFQFRGAVEWALMVALVFSAGAIAQAQDDHAQDDAKVIQIGPADAQSEVTEFSPHDGDMHQQPAMPKYWIGLLGEPVTPDLRHHVVIPDGEGVVIRQVVPDSPAAKAGIEQYDIVVRANDTPLHDIHDLADIVVTEGEKQAQITLEVLRHGERDTVYVTPEERPAQVAQYGGLGRGGFGGGFGGMEGLPEELQGFFNRAPQDGQAFDFRNFGPGVIVGGRGFGAAQMPNGVSVSIQKQDGEPTKITVKRGEESWEVVGDDPESLQQLPEDLRPFVERMLDGGMGDFNIDLPQFGPHGGFGDERFQKRLEEMERRLQEMQERMFGPHDDADEHENGEPDA